MNCLSPPRMSNLVPPDGIHLGIRSLQISKIYVWGTLILPGPPVPMTSISLHSSMPYLGMMVPTVWISTSPPRGPGEVVWLTCPFICLLKNRCVLEQVFCDPNLDQPSDISKRV